MAILLHIARARPEAATDLTNIAFAAKRHWGYPESWMESWRGMLALQPEFIANRETYAAVLDGRTVGFYALSRKDQNMELVHLWVLPDAMGRGVGRSLFAHALEQARKSGCRELEIESDPNAAGFYQHMGANRAGIRTRELDGPPRDLPVFIYNLHSVP